MEMIVKTRRKWSKDNLHIFRQNTNFNWQVLPKMVYW